jgi:hypothetical protein
MTCNLCRAVTSVWMYSGRRSLHRDVAYALSAVADRPLNSAVAAFGSRSVVTTWRADYAS